MRPSRARPHDSAGEGRLNRRVSSTAALRAEPSPDSARAANYAAKNNLVHRQNHNPSERRANPPSKVTPGQIRVLICDDHGLVRSGLRLLLEGQADIHVVEEAGSAAEAVRRTRMEKPDLVLLDISMPGISGLEAIPKIRAAAPKAKVLVLSMHDDPTYVREAFATGASGYLPKDVADVDLVTAVREVAAGQRYVHPTLGARLASDKAAPTVGDANPLSEREHEVLRLLALGNTNQEIAKMLYISVRTAETHRAHIMQKLHLETRAELVRYAIATGTLGDPERTD